MTPESKAVFKKWGINSSVVFGTITILGGLFVFLLGYNDRIVRVEVAVTQVTAQIIGLRDDLSGERAERREDNQEARQLSRMDNAEERQKARNSAAADRSKASAQRELDRKKSLANNAEDRTQAQFERDLDRRKEVLNPRVPKR